jgi:hypothetical protein
MDLVIQRRAGRWNRRRPALPEAFHFSDESSERLSRYQITPFVAIHRFKIANLASA